VGRAVAYDHDHLNSTENYSVFELAKASYGGPFTGAPPVELVDDGS